MTKSKQVGDGVARLRDTAARVRGTAAGLRGAAAEHLAADYLQARGLDILARNLRCRLGELDLVCLEGDVLVIVEVRQRSSMQFGGALASVTPRKQRRLIRAAQFHWQRTPGWRSRVIRFDVITIQTEATANTEGAPQLSSPSPRIDWIRDAFRGST